jgi:Cd2+/Zn2+-exporting ATPase
LDVAAPTEVPKVPYWYIIRLVIAGLIALFCTYLPLPETLALTDGLSISTHILTLAGYAIAYLLAGYKIIWRALRNIARGKFFDENFLMTVASIGAFAIGEYEEAVTVLIFFGIGELLQNNAIARSKRSIAALMDIRPQQAHLITDDTVVEVHPKDVSVGSLIQVRPGQGVPLDGTVVEGSSFLDGRALTGESIPQSVSVGSEVLSGAINLESTLTVKTTAEFGQSAASKILDLVQNAQNKKAQSEQFITRFARIYTPAVLGIAALVALVPPLLGWGTLHDYFYNALVFLVISCPCALVISIPLSFFGGIGGASKHGILVKGGNYLEALARTEVMVLDKTGTLTQGNFVVTSCVALGDMSTTELLSLAASAESHSSHPIATSILAYAQTEGAVLHEPRHVTEHPGYGVVAAVADHTVVVGSADLLVREGASEVPALDAVSVFVAQDGVCVGYITIEDEIRPGTKDALDALRRIGVGKLVMLTGDGAQVAHQVADRVGIDEAYPEMLPADKLDRLEKIMAVVRPPSRVAAVGDGINDAPVLSRADVGIAMGGIGSEATIQAADIVIMNDDVSKLSVAIEIARKTKRIVSQNIVFALGTKLVIMALALFGITSIWFAIFADVGVALIALANALRASRV